MDIEEGCVDGFVDWYWGDVRSVDKLWGVWVFDDGDDYGCFGCACYSGWSVISGSNIELWRRKL